MVEGEHGALLLLKNEQGGILQPRGVLAKEVRKGPRNGAERMAWTANAIQKRAGFLRLAC